ncbi:MAG: right-handed parallel beta-helix repeat-containing protein [Cycloclasticus sp.]|nr:right-handed parallel beta-helix repeat-containing protein [Cycloclasticus sp.]
MKNLKLLFTLSLLILASTSLHAKDYYVCPTGDDANNGLSEATPFASYEKGINTFATVAAGDSVLFCRGGTFPITKGKNIKNTNCSVEVPCTLGDYGDKTADKPLITSSSAINALSFYGNVDASLSGGGYIIKNLSLVSTTGEGKGVFLYIGVHDMLIENLHIQGFKVGMQITGSTTHSITLKDSVVMDSGSQGVLGGCNDCLYENNHFENNGSGVFDHNIYLASGKGGAAKNMTVRGNTLYKSSMVDGKCDGVSLVVHGKFEDLTIENNLIKEDAGTAKNTCYGISVDPGYADEEYFKNVIIRGNTLLNVGGNAIGCASCDGALIENNLIIDQGSTLVNAIAVPVRTEDAVKSKNITIRNNRILMTKNWNETSGVRVGGSYPISVVNNDINLVDYPLSECVRGSEKNVGVNDSLNTCKKTVSATMLEQLVQDLLGGLYEETPVEETPVEETPVEETPVEETHTKYKDTKDTSLNSSEKSNSRRSSKMKDILVNTTYKAGSLFSGRRTSGSDSGTVGFTQPKKSCQVFARGQCLM